MQTLKESLKTIIISAISLSLISIAYAWTEPSFNPPAGNVSAPINTSTTAQIKEGDLIIANSSSDGPNLKLDSTANKYGYFDNYFGTLRYITEDLGSSNPALVVGNDGNVGIGTSAPGGSLEIRSSNGARLLFKERLQDDGSEDSYGSEDSCSGAGCGSETCDTANNEYSPPSRSKRPYTCKALENRTCRDQLYQRQNCDPCTYRDVVCKAYYEIEQSSISKYP